MTAKLYIGVFMLLAGTLYSCQKDEEVNKLDADYRVMTDYDPETDFSQFRSYYLADSILFIGHQYLPFCGIHRFTLLVAGIFRLLESFLLGEQSLEVATGSLEENSKNVHQYTMKYKGRLEKTEEFGNMVIRSLPNGEVLRLKDVATIKLGAQNYVINGQIDGHPAATCMIFQTAGSNANEVVGEINDYLEIIEKELPKDVKIAHLMSTKDWGMQVSFRLTTYL